MRRSLSATLVLVGLLAAPVQSSADDWTSRAEAAANKLLHGPDGPVIATSIQRILHPTGSDPTLGAVEVTHEKDKIDGTINVNATIVVYWHGALGGRHTTTALWAFGKKGHLIASMWADDAPIPASKDSSARLDVYFRTQIYPRLLAKMQN